MTHIGFNPQLIGWLIPTYYAINPQFGYMGHYATWINTQLTANKLLMGLMTANFEQLWWDLRINSRNFYALLG